MGHEGGKQARRTGTPHGVLNERTFIYRQIYIHYLKACPVREDRKACNYVWRKRPPVFFIYLLFWLYSKLY